MICTISAYLTALLIKEQIITRTEKEIYEYGFEITIANLINGLIILCVGSGLHLFIEAILFYLIFVSLRFFCGGYHANSYTRCFLSFSLTSGLCLIVAKWISKYENTVIILFVIATTALGICIFRLAPVEHENRLLTPKEKKIFRKRSIQLYIFWSVIGIILWQAHLIRMEASLISTFIAVSILMIGGDHHEKRSL